MNFAAAQDMDTCLGTHVYAADGGACARLDCGTGSAR